MGFDILVADDDRHILDILSFAVTKAGHGVRLASDGTEAMRLFAERVPDIVVLDIGMPGMDGLDVCRAIRSTSNVPILFLSARDEEIDRILGLEIGGDDYVVKPFSPRELTSRISAIMRRTGARKEAPEADVLSKGAVRIDRNRRSVRAGEASIALTATEFAILACLMERPGFVRSRDAIMDAAHGPAISVSDRTIDSHVRNIRSKFGAAGCADVVETVHGAGFRIGSCALADGAA